MEKTLSLVIPAYNEAEGIGDVLAEIRRTLEEAGIDAEIIVVDDGSSDDTGKAAAAAGARVLHHRANRGYGASLKSGIRAARHETIAIIDADGTYPPGHLPEMLEALETADMVIGGRTGPNVRIPLIRKPAKWLLNRLANFVAKAKIPDLNSGLRVFRRDVVMQYFPILPDQFSWTTTITLAMHCDKYAVTYIPIEYRKRAGRSKIVPWDAYTFAVLILRTAMLFHPLRVFLPLVLLCFGYGVVKMIIDLTVVGDRNISASAMLMLLSSLLILLIGMLGDALSTRMGRLAPNSVASARPNDYVEWTPEHGADGG